MPKKDPKPTTRPKRPSAPGRVRRLCVRLGILVVAIAALTVVLVTQTGVLTGLVVPIIERETSLEVVTGTVTLDGNGRVVISDAVLRAPSIDGLAGEIIRLDRAMIELDWFKIHKGTAAFTRVRVNRPRLRVSIDNDTGAVNLAQFNIRKGSGGGVATPEIIIDRGVLEIGEHTGADYTMLKRLSVVGELGAPDADGTARLNIAARQTESALAVSTTDNDEIMISGTIGDDGLEATMTGLTLENWPPAVVPSTIRPRYRALELTGNLAPTVFRIDRDGKASATLRLDGVDLNLPIPPAASAPGRTEPLRMRATRGTLEFAPEGLSADLQGDIDKLRYDVRLSTKGYKPNSAFDATLRTRLTIDDAFKPLLFVPDSVTSNLNRFEGVSADVDAIMTIVRKEQQGDTPSPVSVSGVAHVTNGSARYKEFPYQVNDIEATIGFTPKRVVIERLDAVGPSGAQMNATGQFQGFDENASVDLLISGQGIPIDRHLMSALDERQRELVQTLFSEDAYRGLLERELLLSPTMRRDLERERAALAAKLRSMSELPAERPEDAQAATRRIDEIDTKLAIPPFQFEGLIELDVRLTRHADRPNDDRWTTDITASLPRAGLVPELFPLPIVARDIVLSVRDGVVELQGGRYEGLTGGYAEVTASVLSGDGTDVPPTVEISAREIPIDERLIAAIPGADDTGAPGTDDITLGRILNRLRLSGVVECDATIGPRANGNIGYDIEAYVLSATAHPVPIDQNLDAGPVPEGIVLEEILGSITVTESMIVVYLDALAAAADGSAPPAPVRMLTQLTLEPQRKTDPRLDPMFGPPTPGPQIYSRLRADSIDLALPLEHAVDVISPSLAQRLAGFRDDSDPSGQVALLAVVSGRVGGALETDLDVRSIRDLKLAIDGHTYSVSDSWGAIGATLGTHPELRFEAFEIPLSVDGGLSATLGADGALPLATPGALVEIQDAPPLSVSVDNGRLGSPGVLQAIRRLGVSNMSTFLDTYGLDGNFDMRIDVDPLDQTRFIRGDAPEIAIPSVAVEGWVAPQTLSVDRAGHTLVFDEITGRVSFTRNGGRFEDIRATGTDTSLNVDGVWTLEDNSGAAIDLRLGATGNALSGPMRAALPDPLLRVIDQLQIKGDSSTLRDDMTIRAGMLGTPNAWYEISGSAQLAGVSLQLGVPVTEMDANLDFDVAARPGAPVDYEIAITADRLRAGPLRMHNAEMSLLNDRETPGAVLVPELRAGMHGGIVTGAAWVGPGRDDQPWVATELRCSGARAAPVFDDLGLPSGALVGPPPPDDPDPYWFWNIDDDLSRGAMTAHMSLSGPAGDINQWTGRGAARVKGGSVVALPGLINLIEASNLKFPTGSSLDLAEADLYLDGSLMAMERLSVSSDSIEILGFGTLDWTSRALDLRFRSRSINPIPLVSAALEGVRNELITTRVSGTLDSIEYTAEQFGTTRRIIDAMLGKPETDQQRRLREIQGRSRYGSGRLRDDTDETLQRPNPIGPSSDITDASELADD